MYCKIHDRYFHEAQVCFACENENRTNWVERDEPTEEEKHIILIEGHKLEIVLLKQENKNLTEAGKDLHEIIVKVRDEKDGAEKLLAWQKTKTDSIEQGYREALEREEKLRKELAVTEDFKKDADMLRDKLEKYKAKLDTVQWHHDFYMDRVKVLYALLRRHLKRCEGFIGEKISACDSWSNTCLLKETKKALELKWNATRPERLMGQYLTGRVPSGGIETHLAICHIWGNPYFFKKVCTCMQEKERD